MKEPRRTPPPLDAAALDRLALRYVERFATTRAKLTDYLARKLRERGWAGEAPSDARAVAERMAALGYIDDRGFAESRAAAMGRRGLGGRRIAGALRQAGIDEADAEHVRPAIEERAEASALAFARRRRLGAYGVQPADRAAREKALAAMLRAGHDYDLSRRIMAMSIDELSEFEADVAARD
ncbi:RecX family transcriptional regulator [Sphingomonas donggukensis]|uniref:Regulatory protein RecX n=1 Tax=Sphingomonas donggukensis TaxID=2949093 RepID=A0ABY4TRS7_9SPHN|nr:RecX family transcriptional regulator [Sphingomonas donggukensis]URW74530.1 RecX family transcriptional regulator [Sphingomonas donggukensis]